MLPWGGGNKTKQDEHELLPLEKYFSKKKILKKDKFSPFFPMINQSGLDVHFLTLELRGQDSGFRQVISPKILSVVFYLIPPFHGALCEPWTRLPSSSFLV